MASAAQSAARSGCMVNDMRVCYPVATEEVSVSIMGLSGAFVENLKLLKANGFDGVELMVRDPRALCVEKVREQLAAHGLQAAAVGVTPMVTQDGLRLASPDPDVRKAAIERALAAVEFAGALSVPFCIGSFRGFVDDNCPGNTIHDAMHAFATISDAAKAHNDGMLLFEPQGVKNGNYLNTVEDGVKWIHDLQRDNVFMILDVFHMHIDHDDLQQALKAAQGLYRFVHLCDSDRRMMGYGGFDLVGFLNALYADGYAGYISTEIQQLPDAADAVKMSAAYYRYYQKVFYRTHNAI